MFFFPCPMYHLTTEFSENWLSSRCTILLTNKQQTKKQTNKQTEWKHNLLGRDNNKQVKWNSWLLTWYFGANKVTARLQDFLETDVGVADINAVFVVVFSRRLTDQRESQTAQHNNHWHHRQRTWQSLDKHQARALKSLRNWAARSANIHKLSLQLHSANNCRGLTLHIQSVHRSLISHQRSQTWLPRLVGLLTGPRAQEQ